MKRILHISNYFYPNFGGIEQIARDVAGAISTTGEWEQKVICFNETAAAGDYVCKREESVHDIVDGVEVIRCGCVTKKASQSISLSFGKQLKEVLRDFDPDIVIFHYPNPFQALYLLRYLKKKTKLVVYWHLDIVKQKLLRKLFYVQTMRLLERAVKVVATSPLYIDGSPYLRKFRDKCQVVPNCINENRMAVTESALKTAERIREENKDKIICFGVGRHIPYKGFKYLIEASQYLDDNIRIYIGGSGELTESLKEQAAGDSKIVFLGRLEENDLVAYYTAADIFCFPSITKNEAFGIALAEGMYFGKPAVTFNIPGSGVNYVNIKDETGLEVANGDSKAYAEAIKKLAEDPDLRKELGEAAERRVRENFTTVQFRKSIIALIKAIKEANNI